MTEQLYAVFTGFEGDAQQRKAHLDFLIGEGFGGTPNIDFICGVQVDTGGAVGNPFVFIQNWALPASIPDQGQIDALMQTHSVAWSERTALASKRDLPRWAFMQTLDDAGFSAAVEALIVAMPAGPDRSRALGKWRHDGTFTFADQDMQALVQAATDNIPGFDVDALWSSGEALAFPST